MIDKHVARLERDGEFLFAIAKQYIDRYPPDVTSKEVLNAVTVQVPLPTFLSLLTVAYQLKGSTDDKPAS